LGSAGQTPDRRPLERDEAAIEHGRRRTWPAAPAGCSVSMTRGHVKIDKYVLQRSYSSGTDRVKIPVQLIRFAMVGVLNTVLHLAVVGVLTQIFGLNQLISNVAAYLVASSFSFIANSIWSFEVRPQARRYARFQVVALLGLLVSGFIGHLGDVFGWHYVITVFLTACIVPLISFAAHRSYTFSR
jgi:putative flippase GtrA